MRRDRWKRGTTAIASATSAYSTRRHSGIGTALMAVMLKEAKDSGARMAVLETQTCNENAIAFYRKHGFEVIGFDLFAYTNDDAARHEIRLEMGRML